MFTIKTATWIVAALAAGVRAFRDRYSLDFDSVKQAVVKGPEVIALDHTTYYIYHVTPGDWQGGLVKCADKQWCWVHPGEPRAEYRWRPEDAKALQKIFCKTAENTDL
jgi:hypothetical protein